MFLILAAVLLFPSHPKVQKLMAKLEHKYPKAFGWLEKLGIGVETPDSAEGEDLPGASGFPLQTNPIIREEQEFESARATAASEAGDEAAR